MNAHWLLPGGLSVWHVESHNKNGEPSYSVVRRDGRMGKSKQRAFYTATGDLVVRCDAERVRSMRVCLSAVQPHTAVS